MIRPRKKPRPGRLKGEELESLRWQCYQRDAGRCKKCLIYTFYSAPQEWANSYHMSHKVAKARGGDNLDNVETLCGACHRAFHNYGPTMEKPCPPKA